MQKCNLAMQKCNLISVYGLGYIILPVQLSPLPVNPERHKHAKPSVVSKQLLIVVLHILRKLEQSTSATDE